MSTREYLMPFVEVGRALSDQTDGHSVVNLIARRITETVGLKGCFIKMKRPGGGSLELLGSFGLSEHFLLSEANRSPGSLFSSLPAETQIVADVKAAENLPEAEALVFEDIQSLAIVPLEVRQTVVAMVALFAGTPRNFDEADLSFAAALAREGMMAFHWKWLMESCISRERQYLKSFQDISEAVNSALTVNKVMELAVTSITEVMGVIGCAVRLLDPKTQQLYVARSYGIRKEFLEKGPVDAHLSMSENLAGKVVIVNDVFTDPRLQYRSAVVEEGIRRILSVPMEVRGKVIGVMRVVAGDRAPFTEEEVSFVTAVAHQCAMAIENARMYQRLKYEYQQLLVDFGYEGSSQ